MSSRTPIRRRIRTMGMCAQAASNRARIRACSGRARSTSGEPIFMAPLSSSRISDVALTHHRPTPHSTSAHASPLGSVWIEGGVEPIRAKWFLGLLGWTRDEQSCSNKGIYLSDLKRARSEKTPERDRTGVLPFAQLPRAPVW
jgi:hypothetical protein